MTPILTVDLESIPQARWTAPDVEVDEAWREEWLKKSWPAERAPEDVIADAIAAGEAVLKATGQLASCHASTCHVVSVSFGTHTPDSKIETAVMQWDDEKIGGAMVGEMMASLNSVEGMEHKLLHNVMRQLAKAVAAGQVIVGFNTKGFDLQILRVRCAILGVAIGKFCWDGPRGGLLYPYSNHPHTDLRLALCGGNRYAKGTLAHWGQVFGVAAEEQGGNVFAMLKAGDWKRLRDYGHAEARTLVELYEKCEGIL